MKKLFTILSFVLLLAISCTRFDDSAIWEELLNHKERIEKLEAECNRLNTNINSLQTILEALQTNDYVTDIVKIMEDGVEVGYSINFAKGGAVTIYHGTDGSDGAAPKVAIKKAGDGEYYWTADGEWLTDEDGAKIPAATAQGSEDSPYITPQFRVAEGIWYISFDNGNTWRPIEPEEEPEPLFLDIDATNEDYVILTLADGSQVKIPKYNKVKNYWYGKKMLMLGPSICIGSGLAVKTDAFPYLVAEAFGMEIKNYSIGGSTISKRSGDYDECYVSLKKWEEDKAAGYLDTSKKYLVNIENNKENCYRIYSYKNSEWVAGGSTSKTTGRTPLSDRVAALDKDADVIMLMGGSNDFYYNWAPFGDFDDSSYRGLGYTDEGISAGTITIDTSKNLITDDVELVHNAGPNVNGWNPSSDNYFSYINIPIIGGKAVKVPYGRHAWMLDKDGERILDINFTLDIKDYTTIAPENAAFLTVCFRYDQIDPEDCAVYMQADNSPTRDGMASNEPNETFCDGLHKLCRYLRHTYPKADIFFLTPIKRVQQDVWDCVYPEDTNKYGKTLNDYREAIIKSCEYYSINYIDIYTLSGLNPHIDPSLFADKDKAVHPNEEGHRNLTDVIVSHMQAMHQYK